MFYGHCVSKDKRYSEIKSDIPNITDMMLSQSLRELVANELVERKQFQEIPPRVEYQMTASGAELLRPPSPCLQIGAQKIEHTDKEIERIITWLKIIATLPMNRISQMRNVTLPCSTAYLRQQRVKASSAVSLGYWQNFGGYNQYENAREITRKAFDMGITCFDLANNYGPPYGSAEETFGRLMKEDMHPYRDEMVITTKAGYDMWKGPYGIGGSRKYLLSSLDQSLKRMGLDYVDIFYHHCMDPETPLEETMGALAHAVKSGKALYVGISNYSPEKTIEAAKLLKDMGIHCLIHQQCYNMLNRKVEKEGLFTVLEQCGMGATAFSPLARASCRANTAAAERWQRVA